MRIQIQTAFVAVVLLWAAPSEAFNVFTLDGGRSIVRWTTLPVSYEVNATFVPYMSDDVDVIRSAFASWSAPQCSAFTSNFTGTTNNQSTSVIEGGTDGRNRVAYTPGGSWPVSLDNALAVTQSSYRGSNRGWNINEADIAFNGGVTWSSSPGRREYDLQSVAAHEIGHLLGIQHTPNPSATMYFSTAPGDPGGASLHEDDQKAACFLYPQGGTWTCENARFDCPEVEGNNERGERVTYGQMGCEDGLCTFGGDVGQGRGQGEVCENFTDCNVDLICVSLGNDSFCTAECNTNQNGGCPQGHTCVGLNGAEDGGGACVPGGDGDGQYGDACEGGSDCASELCIIGSEDEIYCSQFCTISTQTCPNGSVCVPLRGQPEDRGGCIFEGDSPPGTVCGSLADCPGGLCLQGPDREYRCREACTFGVGARCAQGTACLPTDVGDACFESGDGQLGESCSQEWDCGELLCLEHPDNNARVCSALCDGTCPGDLSCESIGQNFSACFDADPGPGPDPDPNPDANPVPEPGADPQPEDDGPGGFVGNDGDDGDNNGAFVGNDGFVAADAQPAEPSCQTPSGKGGTPWVVLSLLLVLGVTRRRVS